jgi:hypothetical protein
MKGQPGVKLELDLSFHEAAQASADRPPETRGLTTSVSDRDHRPSPPRGQQFPAAFSISVVKDRSPTRTVVMHMSC